jgi:hypothetical protein
MEFISRRWFIKGTVVNATGQLWGCGGGGAGQTAAPTEPIPGSPPAPPTAVTAGKYRFNQPYLLQAVPSKHITHRLPEGWDYLWDRFGPTYKAADSHTGWLWTKPGGDWIDATGKRDGTSPWFSIPVNKGEGSNLIANYDGDVTLVARYVQEQQRWFALILLPKGAPRTIAGTTSVEHAAPYIEVTYSDGQKAKLEARVVAENSRSSAMPNTTAASYAMPVFVEFDIPRSKVESARLFFTITQHWSGANPTIEGFLLDPPITAEDASLGLAATVGTLDAGIEGQPAVIGAHRYLDGKSLSDFVHDGEKTYSAEKNYDPAIFGTGPTDTSKFPHAGLGKWINAGDSWSMVASGYSGDGFKPLAPGLGAIRLHMPAHAGVRDGSLVGSSGTLAGDAKIFLPEALFGYLGRIFVRYYFRLGTPYRADVAKRFEVYQEPGQTEWTTYAGKFGIGPDHSTYAGGVSGSSGGGYGWQMRLSWYECDAGTSGPDEGGWAPGFHLYDFNFRNPPGHNYGQGDGGIPELWGQRGGVGGILYAGHWYCIETELKLNTVMPTAPGYVADGELRAWVDGRLAYQRTGMVFRTLPLAPQPYNASRTRACRELGVQGLWLDWFHGGKTVATFDRTSFYTGLVWSKEYIGPMKLPA